MSDKSIAFSSVRRSLVLSLAALIYSTKFAQSASTVVGPIRSIDDYLQALAVARMQNRYALVDVAAEWCPFCKTIENEILTHPRVKERMSRLALLKVDVTSWSVDSRKRLALLKVTGPPTVFIIDVESDLAPKFYPVLSSLQRFWVAVLGAVAAGCGAEPFRLRSTASRRGLIV